MTNREYLSTLSNEELAIILYNNVCCSDMCIYYDKCNSNTTCTDGIKQWLEADYNIICPHCKKNAKLCVDFDKYYIKCFDCGFTSPKFSSVNDALSFWNKMKLSLR